MARRLNRLVSIVLSATLVVLSIGLDAQQAAAQTFTGRAAPVSPTPQVGLGSSILPAPNLAPPALSLSAPSLSAPSVLISPAPVALVSAVAAVALKPVTPAAAIAEKVLAAAPVLQALAKPETAGSAASAAGRELENVLTGAKSSRVSGEAADVVAGVPSALTPVLAAASAAPEAPKTDAVPAVAPAPKKTVASASSYSAHRLALKAVAALTGAVFTLPQASMALSAKVIASAADKALVLSDFDDTLAGYNEVLPADKVEAVRKIKAAGKEFAVISDRSDTKRGTQLTVFESLESLPVDVRAGMYVAANSGGKVYQYDAQGVPQKVHEAAGLTDEQNVQVKAAAEATKARLAEVGAVQHVGDGKNPGESLNTYGYAIMLKPGSSEDSVRGVAKILNEELAKRGFDVEVQPRFAKSPENPPYATFSIITKADAAAYIAGALKIQAKDALVIGDSMFVPRAATKDSWMARAGEKLSGRAQVKIGNETDRNMTKLLPGVLALGVGEAMDPRTPNGWALYGRGPSVTQLVLESVASKSRKIGPDGGSDHVGTAIQLGVLGLFLGVLGLAFYLVATNFAEWVANGERLIRDGIHNPEAGFYLGATTLGMVGMMGLGRLPGLPNPGAAYAQALKRATEIAAERGASADQVLFAEATASQPAHNGAQWSYTFQIPGAMVYVDVSNFFGGTTPDIRSSLYKGAPALLSSVPQALAADRFASLVGLDAEHALIALRDKLPGFGGSYSVSLAPRAAEDGNGAQMTYRFFDNSGSVGTVGSNGAFVRVDSVSANAAKEAVKKKVPSGLTSAVAPNELYALALANMKEQAAKDGDAADKIQFLSAVHETRTFNGAWVGDEWRFHFASGGFTYMVPARRTMITETMMDAFAPQRTGLTYLGQAAQGVAAGLFNMGVKVTPDAALNGVDGVTRVSLLPRVEPVSGDKDLWYSLQNGGEEVAAVNARTGEVRRPAAAVPTDGKLKSFLTWLIGAALVALIYGGFYYAMSHAPAAVPQGLPEGYNGPVPSIDQVFRGMGGFLGLGVLAGTLKSGSKKPKVSDDDVRASAKSVASSKGGVWSQTEYNMGYSNTLESLKTRGATKKQLALFKQLCDEAPVIGGRFNPWSGD